MDRYKKLLSNTLIFTIGTFGSKLLVFALMPFYTRILTKGQFGIVDIIVQTSNLIIPLASVGINNSIIRFGLEKGVNKKGVLTVGIFTILGGFVLMCFFYPLLKKISFISQYTVLIYVYVLCSCIHSLFANFVKAKGYSKLYAFDGIGATVSTVILNVVFLAACRMGVKGYVLATVVSDIISSFFLLWIAKLYKQFSIKSIEKTTAVSMLKYAIPLIPTTVCSWIINISDRYIITYKIGEAMNGLYATANRIPTILLLVANIFGDAWQISAVTERDKEARCRFFSNVSNVYVSVAFLTGSVLILFSKIIMKIMVSSSYYIAWQFIPILVMATTFACLSQFLGSVYMVGKKSIATLINTMIGALINIGLNILMIPSLGAQGAGIATFISYFSMFFIKAIHTRRYIKIKWNMPKLCLNSIILGMQCYIMVGEVHFWAIYESALFIASFLLNIDDVIKSVSKVLPGTIAEKFHLTKYQ